MDQYSNNYLPKDKEDRKKYYFALREENAFDFKKWNCSEQAAALYFLMKTGFNGIWQINKNTNGRFGTPSGLLNQKDKVYDKENVMGWHKVLNSITIHLSSKDWSDVPLGDFTFYDPPYRNSFTSYGTVFPDSETEKLIKVVENNSDVWLSNRDSGDGFFGNRKCEKCMFDVTYTAGRRKKSKEGTFPAKSATEVLLYNP